MKLRPSLGAKEPAMRMRWLVAVMVVFSGWLPRAGLAQESSGGIIFSRYRQFRIPFNPPSNNIKQLQLYVSVDQGKSWQPSATAPPEQKHFRFLSDRDGYFWFTVQTADMDNRLFPPTLDGAAPSLKVIVDTQPPAIQLQPLPPRTGEVGVAWEIADENLDNALPDAARLEFRTVTGAWLPLSIPPGGNRHYWNPQAGGPVEVRLRARDRAGNYNEAVTSVSLTGNQGGHDALQHNPQPNNSGERFQDAGTGSSDRKLVNSKRINLNYEVKDVGPSGVSLVELWYTQNGRNWEKYIRDFGGDGNLKNISFDVVGEGLYGLTLVAKSGVGLGDRPPQIGDRPQIWIEVDLTKPTVQMQNVVVGTGVEKGKLTISWAARDQNLSRDPITLSYAENASGPWTPFAEKLSNSGRYVWMLPDRGIPYQFHLKVEAIDRAGNIGEAITETAVKVDLSQPKVKILTIEPAGK